MVSKHDVFLSHGSPDADWVRGLYDELRALGLTAFLDKVEIGGGDNFVGKLSNGLDDSGALVLVLSSHTLERPWVEQEWTAFMATHGPRQRILPVLLQDVKLPAFLRNRNVLRAVDRDAAAVAKKIAATLGKGDDGNDPFPGAEFDFWVGRGEDDEKKATLTVRGTDGKERTVPAPWREHAFVVAWMEYGRLIREATETDKDRADLIRHARVLGTAFHDLLLGEPNEAARFEAATKPGAACPQLRLCSDDDLLLSLPWELIFDGTRFLVRDGAVDLVRTTGTDVDTASFLRQPTEPFSVVTNVSAPSDSKLDYEAEAYRITLALTNECKQTPTELGTLRDLVDTVAKLEPTGIHFSGHGLPGSLVFENDVGDKDVVPVGTVLERLGTTCKDKRLPRFFYLASCHGNTQPAPEKGKSGSESAAAQLHRAGITQVVGYYGPIVDELSTRAEEALYRAIADGETTRSAVFRARQALLRGFEDKDARQRPARGDAAHDEAAQSPNRTHTFAWAQLVFYHRGEEFPLGTKVDRKELREAEAKLQRTFDADLGFESRRMLSAGFIGRRTDLHRIRRSIEKGDKVFVLQGLGGLGKTTLAGRVVRMLAHPKATCTIWCQEIEKHENKGEALVGQLLEFCRARFGPDWEGVVSAVDRGVSEDPAARFAAFLQVLIKHFREPLVVYLDNLESLLVGPRRKPTEEPPDPEAFGTWREDTFAKVWAILAQAAKLVPTFHLVASYRYRNADFGPGLIPIGPLPNDAVFRLMPWFPALRQLSPIGRAYLVHRLEGHPRAVEFTNDLVDHRLQQWLEEQGKEWTRPAVDDEAGVAAERAQILDPAIHITRERVWDDLLLHSLWNDVLDELQQRMLLRMTLLRGSWEPWLIPCLGEPGEAEELARARASDLAATSLLEQEETLVAGPEGPRRVRRYTVHPATSAFVREAFGEDAGLQAQTHLRLGEAYEARCQSGKVDLGDMLAAGYHLFQADEFDRSYKLLGQTSEWLQNRGKVREGLAILRPFLAEQAQARMTRLLAGRMLGTVGMAYHRLGEVHKAIGHYEQHLVIAREIGDRRGEGGTLGNLGIAYAALGEPRKAIEHFQQYLIIARETGDRRGEGSTLGNLGSAYYRLGEVGKAIEHHLQALVISREIGDRQGEGSDLGNLGLAYFRLGEVHKAIEHQQQALGVAREVGDRHGQGSALGNLGLAYAYLGEVHKAIEHHHQALVIAREIGDRRGEGSVLGNLGNAYAHLGEVHKAIEHLERALAIGEEIHDPQIVSIARKRLEELRAGEAGA
ncbi:MAG: tetratricopeptide repeat protein [Planctomycetota bacterium]